MNDERKYFVSKYLTVIRWQKYDAKKVAYDFGKYFDSWEDASKHLMARLLDEREAAKKELLKSNQRIARAISLKDPKPIPAIP